MKAVILWITLTSLLCFSAHAQDGKKRICPGDEDYIPVSEQPLNSVFYRIMDCKSRQDSFILGTLHSSSKDITQTVQHVPEVIANVNEAWFEYVSKPEDQTVAARYMFIPPDGQTLSQRVGEKVFHQLLNLFAQHAVPVKAEQLERYKPWAASLILQTLSIDTSGIIMDDVLQHFAEDHHIKVKGIETVERQFSLFDNFSSEEEVLLLEDAVRQFDRNVALNEQLVEQYKKQDLRSITNIADDAFSSMQNKALEEKLERLLLLERNAFMAESLRAPLRKGNIFIAVGALHLPYNSGLLQSFENDGYGIEALYSHSD